MTDRYDYLTVALERDTRSDDAQALIAAISLLRGVLRVEPHVVDGTTLAATERARREIRDKIADIVFPRPG
jgi:hypothetical protein